MSKKFFVQSEWDDDVPDVDYGETLKKVGKIKRFKKNETNVVESEINGGAKRKISTFETPAKKKKRAESDSYVKFESPSVDSIMNPLDVTQNGQASSPDGQTISKKNKKKSKFKNLVTIDKTQDNDSVPNNESQLEIIEKPVKNSKKNNKKSKLKNLVTIDKTQDNDTVPATESPLEIIAKPVKNIKKKKLLKNSQSTSVEKSSPKDESPVNGTGKVSKNKRKKDKKKSEQKQNEKKEVSLPNVVSTGSSSLELNSKPQGNKKKSNLYLKKIKNLLENVTMSTSENENAATENEEKPPKDETNTILMEMNEVQDKKSPSKQKSLRERMMERLKGARFRYLNEQMYRHNSNDAIRIFKQDPGAFKAYHEGYQQQVNKWPMNPLDVIIKEISRLPKTHVIADLGCGDGRLAKSVPHKVFSFDLVALDSTINVCDMAHTPLQTGQVDCIVFCLSLMGTNSKDYIMEANRILKTGGLLKIAEVESRFENVDQFTDDLKKYGFSLVKKDYNHQIFYFMDFKKENDVKKRNKVPQITLNPCIYKKR